MTVKVIVWPVNAWPGDTTRKCVATGAGFTCVMALPVMLAVVVSVAVRVWLPKVAKVALK